MDADDRRRAASHVVLEPADALLLDRGVIVPSDDVAHHLRRVLRLRDGERVSVTDGAGRWRMSVVRSSDAPGSSLSLEAVGDVMTDAPDGAFTLVTAIPKGDRVDWLVQKTTEIGVDRIVFVHAERSSVRWSPERSQRHLARLRRIADESLRQSRRVWRTDLEGPVDATSILATTTVAEPGAPVDVGDLSAIAIGPEGGWTERELDLAPRRVGLGDSVLRIETAAVVAAVLRLVR